MSSTRQNRQAARQRGVRRKARNNSGIAAAMAKATVPGAAYQVLSDDDVLKVHRAALELLERVGMGSATPRVIEVALANGCTLSDKGRLCFPRALVEDTLVKAAKSFVVHGRTPEFDFEAGTGTLNFCTGGAAVKMLDIHSRRYRDSTLADLHSLARLCDTLENIQWFARPVVATEIENLLQLDVNTVYACAAGTRKHIATSIVQGSHVREMLPLFDMLAGGVGQFARRPFCTVHATTVVSPMNFAPDSLDVAVAAVDIGMPIHCQTGPQAGATAPAALAGTLAQGCAESLASLTIINLLQPGYPVVMGNWVFVSDLRTGAFSGGGGEQALLGAAAGQMAAFYGVPGGVGAGMTDSKIPDQQAGFEKGLTLLLAGLSNGGLVYESAGMLASLLGCSFESMVIDNELLSSVRRIARGIEVSDATLSVPVVEEAVHGRGHFLGSEQTMALMDSEFVYPQLADRASVDDWHDAGSADMWDRATLRAKEILGAHTPHYISSEVDRRIRDHYKIRLPDPTAV